MAALAPSALARLREVWDAYVEAPPGQLNRTADALTDTARALGWPGGRSPVLWVKEKLGVD